MKINELPEQCKTCFNLRILSLYMDNNHDYSCSKYPITKVKRESYCPIKNKEEDNDKEC